MNYIFGFAAVTTKWPRWAESSAASSESIRIVSWNIGAGIEQVLVSARRGVDGKATTAVAPWRSDSLPRLAHRDASTSARFKRSAMSRDSAMDRR